MMIPSRPPKLRRERRSSRLGKHHKILAGLLLAISLAVNSLAETQETTVKTSNEDNQTQTTSVTKLPLDFDTLASQLQQDEVMRVEAVLKVIGDINDLKNNRRLRASELITRAKSEHKQIVYDDATHSKRVGREHDFKMSVATEGVSKTDEFYFWKVLHNATTILVVRSINKYYYWDWVQNVGAFILLIIILAGNSSILHRLKLSRRRRSNVNYFIVHLAIADLLVGIFSLTLDTTLRMMKYFPGDLFACQASKFFTNFFIYSSTNLLVALSVDRWEAVVKPLAFTKNRSRGLYLVVGSWVLAGVTSVPVTFYMKVAEIEGVTQCWIDMSNYVWRIYMIYLTCLLLIIPTLIIAICYIHIVYTIWSKGRLGDGAGKRRDEKREKGSNFSSSFYGANSNPSQQELLSGSVASRLQTRASNLSEESARFESRIGGSKRILWANIGGGGSGSGNRSARTREPLRQRANTCESKTVCGNETNRRRAGSDSSAPAAAVETTERRLAKFERNGTDEMGLVASDKEIGASGESIGLERREPDGPSKRSGGTATSLTGRHCNTNNENRAQATARVQANGGCCSVESNPDNEPNNQASSRAVGGQSTTHGSQVARQCAQTLTQTASGNDENNRHPEPVKTAEMVTSSLQEAPVGQRQHKSSVGRVASQGLRMLSFARSHSSSSVSSSASSIGSSSSTIATESRPTIAAELTETVPERGSAGGLTSEARQSHYDGDKDAGRLRAGSELAQKNAQVGPVATGETLESSMERDNESPPREPADGDRNDEHNHFDLNSKVPQKSQPISGGEKSKFSVGNSDTTSKDREQKQIDQQHLPVQQSSGGNIKFGASGGRERDFVPQQHGSGVIPKARIKTIKMTLVIVATYILCWSPFVIVNFLNTFGVTEQNHFWQAMSTCTQTFAHINSAVNPLIFWLFSGGRSQTSAANRKRQTNQLNSNQPAARPSNKIATNGAL